MDKLQVIEQGKYSCVVYNQKKYTQRKEINNLFSEIMSNDLEHRLDATPHSQLIGHISSLLRSTKKYYTCLQNVKSLTLAISGGLNTYAQSVVSTFMKTWDYKNEPPFPEILASCVEKEVKEKESIENTLSEGNYVKLTSDEDLESSDLNGFDEGSDELPLQPYQLKDLIKNSEITTPKNSPTKSYSTPSYDRYIQLTESDNEFGELPLRSYPLEGLRKQNNTTTPKNSSTKTLSFATPSYDNGLTLNNDEFGKSPLQSYQLKGLIEQTEKKDD